MTFKTNQYKDALYHIQPYYFVPGYEQQSKPHPELRYFHPFYRTDIPNINGAAIDVSGNGKLAIWRPIGKGAYGATTDVVCRVEDIGNQNLTTYAAQVPYAPGYPGFGDWGVPDFAGLMKYWYYGIIRPVPGNVYPAGTYAFTRGIQDAWRRADTAVFEDLRTFVNCVEGLHCFRGFLPVKGDADAYSKTNVWSLSTGGGSDFLNERLQGTSGNWCSMRTDGVVRSLWSTRAKAEQFAGAVLAWLQSQAGKAPPAGITAITLQDIAMEPVPYVSAGLNPERHWLQEIKIEIVYETEDP